MNITRKKVIVYIIMVIIIVILSIIIIKLFNNYFYNHGQNIPNMPLKGDRSNIYSCENYKVCNQNDIIPSIGLPCDCYFSEGYWEARSKFRTAVSKIEGAELHTLIVIPNSDYTIDIAVINGTMGLMVHTSGIHGVEGYAGSAIQLALLDRLQNKSRNGQPTIVLIHAYNPFGMAHFRRWNENNVDLNRNAMLKSDGDIIRSRDPNIAGYMDLTNAFNPSRKPSLYDAYIRLPLSMIYHSIINGSDNIKHAMVAAQYVDPKGIFYGGDRLEKSHVLIWNWMDRFANKQAVSWIDVHTGLGNSGEDTLLCDGGDVMKTHTRWYPGVPKVQNETKGEGDVGGGYELTRGFNRELFTQKFRNKNAKIHHMTQEFGTLSGHMVARALILENQAYNYAPNEQAYWATFTRDAFYVRTPEWKQSIIDRGVIFAEQAIERSRITSKELNGS